MTYTAIVTAYIANVTACIGIVRTYTAIVTACMAGVSTYMAGGWPAAGQYKLSYLPVSAVVPIGLLLVCMLPLVLKRYFACPVNVSFGC